MPQSLLIAVGQDQSVDPQIGFLAQSKNSGNWSVQAIDGPPASTSLYAACVTANLAITSGIADNNNAYVAQTTNNGLNWISPTVMGIVAGTFFGAGCASAGTTVGVAVGQSATGIAIIAKAINGVNWEMASLPGMVSGTAFNGAGCGDFGSEAICIAVGTTPSFTILFYLSTDSAMTWTPISLSSLQPGDLYGALVLANTGLVAVGQSNNEGFIIQSSNGQLWSMPTILNSPASSTLRTVSGASNGTHVMYAAAGMASTSYYIAQSINNGTSWESLVLPSTGGLNAIKLITHPTTLAINGIAIGSGGHIYQTKNGGESWVLQTIANLPISTSFNAIDCKENSVEFSCVVAGQYGGPPPFHPILVVTNDSGDTWSIETVVDEPVDGSYSAAGATSGRRLELAETGRQVGESLPGSTSLRGVFFDHLQTPAKTNTLAEDLFSFLEEAFA
ncbi:MAG: hypothetical protein Q7V63_03015 [Gammaproteobacteria bacterium]|nr:hypothetical protein [Gammaproteobacteria bacterium]